MPDEAMFAKGSKGGYQPGGKGKGKSKGPAPPPPSGAYPKRPGGAVSGLPAKRAIDGPGGMSGLLEAVRLKGETLDKTSALEYDALDLSSVDPDAKGETFECPRCHKQILVTLRDSHRDSHSTQILPWLYLGGSKNADNAKELTERTGITHILNLAHEVNQDHDAKAIWEEYNQRKGVPCEYRKFSWYDLPDQDIIKEMEGPIGFIRHLHASDADHRVLVHCVQGISRSTCVIICYLMMDHNMSLREAYQHVKERRPIADPRAEFIKQLGTFECELFKRSKPSIDAEEIYAGKHVLNVDFVEPPRDPDRPISRQSAADVGDEEIK